MPADSLGHIISLSADNSNEKRRYICITESTNKSANLFGFINGVYPEGVHGEPVEFWKCIYRSCNVRLCSRNDLYYPIRDASSDNVPRHVHPPNFSNDFFSKHEFKVEKSVMLVKTSVLPHSTSPFTSNVRHKPYSKNAENSFRNGAVLKQLLTAGKDKEKKGMHDESGGWKTRQTWINTSPSPPAEAESPGKMLPIRPMLIRPLSKLTDDVEWSPPVLSPPPSGVYKPAFTRVAHIEPYVEPQVMYNPLFLWQLHSYRMEEENRTLCYTTSPTSSGEFST